MTPTNQPTQTVQPREAVTFLYTITRKATVDADVHDRCMAVAQALMQWVDKADKLVNADEKKAAEAAEAGGATEKPTDQ